MRVLFFVNTFPVLSETFVINQVAGVLARGHEVHVYASSGRPQNTDNMHPEVAKYGLMDHVRYGAPVPPRYGARIFSGASVLARNGIAGFGKSLRLLNPWRHGRQALSLWLLHQGAGLIRDSGYDVIHAEFGTVALTALALIDAGVIRGRLVTTFRGYDISRFVREQGADVYDDLFLRGAYFMTNCDFFRSRLIAMGCDGERLVTHFSGLNLAKFRYRQREASPDGTVRILTVGRFVEKKGLVYAIRAVAELLNKGIPIEYQIIGSGPLEEEIRQLIDGLGRTSSIRLIGAMQQSAIITQLDQSDIFLAPSVTAADGDQDAPTNVLKEAMATGIPVVSTLHGGIPEIVQHGVSGLLVPERDSAALASALRELIASPERRAEMGRQGRAQVEALCDINKLNDDLVRIYQRAMQPKPASRAL